MTVQLWSSSIQCFAIDSIFVHCEGLDSMLISLRTAFIVACIHCLNWPAYIWIFLHPANSRGVYLNLPGSRWICLNLVIFFWTSIYKELTILSCYKCNSTLFERTVVDNSYSFTIYYPPHTELLTINSYTILFFLKDNGYFSLIIHYMIYLL